MEILTGNVSVFNFEVTDDVKEENGGGGIFSSLAGHKTYTTYNIRTVVSND
jgi:hypothetical protein